MQMLDSRGDSSMSGSNSSAKQKTSQTAEIDSSFDDMDDDLPF